MCYAHYRLHLSMEFAWNRLYKIFFTMLCAILPLAASWLWQCQRKQKLLLSMSKIRERELPLKICRISGNASTRLGEAAPAWVVARAWASRLSKSGSRGWVGQRGLRVWWVREAVLLCVCRERVE